MAMRKSSRKSGMAKGKKRAKATKRKVKVTRKSRPSAFSPPPGGGKRPSGVKYRIVTLSGRGLPTVVDAAGYDTRLAAEAMAESEHEGEWRVEPMRPAKSSAPATEWERLWRRYTAANKSGSLKEQLAAGKALLRFDRTHGTPPLPSLAKKLRTAKQLLVRHEEAFREAKALKHEIGKAEKSMHGRKPSRKTASTPSRRNPRLSRLLSG